MTFYDKAGTEMLVENISPAPGELGYSSSGKTLTATGAEAPLTLKKPILPRPLPVD